MSEVFSSVVALGCGGGPVYNVSPSSNTRSSNRGLRCTGKIPVNKIHAGIAQIYGAIEKVTFKKKGRGWGGVPLGFVCLTNSPFLPQSICF